MLSLSTLERAKATAALRLYKQAQADIAANPNNEGQILDALAAKTEVLNAAIDRNYEASRRAETGIGRFFQQYSEEATNAAKNAESVSQRLVGGLEDSLTGALSGKKDAFKGLVDSILQEMTRLYTVKPLLANIFGTNGSNGWLGQGFDSIAGKGSSAAVVSDGSAGIVSRLLGAVGLGGGGKSAPASDDAAAKGDTGGGFLSRMFGALGLGGGKSAGGTDATAGAASQAAAALQQLAIAARAASGGLGGSKAMTGESATLRAFQDDAESAGRALQGVGSDGTQASTGIGSLLQGFRSGSDYASAGLDTLAKGSVTAADSLGSMLSSLGSALSSYSGAGSSGGGWASLFETAATSLAVGTNYVPYDGFKAVLHEGEAVVPKAYNVSANPALMKAMSGVTNDPQPVQVVQHFNFTDSAPPSRATTAQIGQRAFAGAQRANMRNG